MRSDTPDVGARSLDDEYVKAAAKRSTNAAWLRAQLEQLRHWRAHNPQRWDGDRYDAAVGLLLEGEVEWCAASQGAKSDPWATLPGEHE